MASPAVRRAGLQPMCHGSGRTFANPQQYRHLRSGREPHPGAGRTASGTRRPHACAIARIRGKTSGSAVEKRQQPFDPPQALVAPQQYDELEQAGTGRAPCQCNSDSMDELSGLDAALRCR